MRDVQQSRFSEPLRARQSVGHINRKNRADHALAHTINNELAQETVGQFGDGREGCEPGLVKPAMICGSQIHQAFKVHDTNLSCIACITICDEEQADVWTMYMQSCG